MFKYCPKCKSSTKHTVINDKATCLICTKLNYTKIKLERNA
jgi:ribosomal protein L33